jgi:copper(I)-binding protein
MIRLVVPALALAACSAPASAPAAEAPAPEAAAPAPESLVPADAATSFTVGEQTVTIRGTRLIAPPAGRDVAAAFMTLQSDGVADRLVAVASPVAPTVEIHDHIHDHATGAMSMQKIDGIDLPAGTPVELRSGGKHVMLFGVTGPLTPGETVDLTLTFASGASVLVPATVEGY